MAEQLWFACWAVLPRCDCLFKATDGSALFILYQAQVSQRACAPYLPASSE